MGKLVQAIAAGRKASILFKTLTRVEVAFNPFDPAATTAREFLKRVRTPPVRKENPQLEIVASVQEVYGAPHIQLTYIDGQIQHITPASSSIVDIIDDVERVARWKGDGSHNPFAKLRAREATAKN